MIKEYSKNDNSKLSENFSLSEFHCHCSRCKFTYLDSDLVDYLQEKRTYLNRSIHLNCGYRCSDHNKEVGGKSGSMHLVGKAADIVVPDMSIDEMADVFSDANGLGIYKTFIHVDVRGYKSRWRG